ncbi:MAG: hypothetical protein JRI84_15995 [Deltaproteobacteria bacterium]|nr:hypothetical protein [Deltaproteobacteria bacterium]
MGQTKAKTELDTRIRSVWKKGPLAPVYFPAEAAEVDDDTKEPKLVGIHYDAASTTQAADKPPDLVLKIFERTGVPGNKANCKRSRTVQGILEI